MMKKISHRGNLNGPNLHRENSPDFINEAIALGYDVEIDVWNVHGTLMLGHDAPTYEIELNFLKNDHLWCHAKNLAALYTMLENNIHCFWHQDDDQTITSRGFIWTHSKSKLLTDRSIACWIDGVGEYPKNCFGICTDFPEKLV
jgi:hypothetical protein